MKNKYYPFIFDLSDKRLLFVGGGKVAERKILLLYKIANITIIAPKVTKILEELFTNKAVKINYKTFEDNDLKENYTLVFACTNSVELNRKIGLLCQKNKMLVFVAGDKELSDFYMPAVFKNEKYLIALSTYGNSPTSAKKIRDYIKGILTNYNFQL
jgi:precorrin-2 dehydrogenase/sirohydrochlorin ferrochelatase